MTRRLLLAAAAVCALAAAAPASAAFPDKPIHIIIPFDAGGPTDVMVRAIAPILNRELGQNIIIENKGGAGGNIGSAYVARSEKDGYTLLAGGSPTVISPFFVKDLTFDTRRDLTAVAPLSRSPYYIVVNKELPVNSVQELIALAKKQPGTVTYASSGIGNRPHVAGAQFGVLTGTKLTHVPYKGTAPATNDLLAGRITFMFIGMATVRGHIQSGRLKVLAVATQQRDPDFPDVPTLAEAGVPNYYPDVWYGLLAPSGIPDDAKQKIAKAVDKALHDPEVIKQYANLGAPPFYADPAKFQAFYVDEIDQWTQFFRDHPEILKD
jgi:tripartite-type tricarboxylate transporter receptor subunit TctC